MVNLQVQQQKKTTLPSKENQLFKSIVVCFFFNKFFILLFEKFKKINIFNFISFSLNFSSLEIL